MDKPNCPTYVPNRYTYDRERGMIQLDLSQFPEAMLKDIKKSTNMFDVQLANKWGVYTDTIQRIRNHPDA